MKSKTISLTAIEVGALAELLSNTLRARAHMHRCDANVRLRSIMLKVLEGTYDEPQDGREEPYDDHGMYESEDARRHRTRHD